MTIRWPWTSAWYHSSHISSWDPSGGTFICFWAAPAVVRHRAFGTPWFPSWETWPTIGWMRGNQVKSGVQKRSRSYWKKMSGFEGSETFQVSGYGSVQNFVRVVKNCHYGPFLTMRKSPKKPYCSGRAPWRANKLGTKSHPPKRHFAPSPK